VFVNVTPRGSGSAASPAKFMHYRQQSSVVEEVSAFNTGVVNLTGGAFPEQLRSAKVTLDFFRLFGAPIELGRGFTPEEDRPGGPPAAVIGRRLWTPRFTADPQVLGRTISLSGEPYAIVGVLGNFDFQEYGPTPQVWLPFKFPPNTSDQGHYFQAAGR